MVTHGRHRARHRLRTNAAPRYASLLVIGAFALAALADVSHTVSPGETLTSIAHKYGTTSKAIATANHIANPDLVFIGEALRIPGAVVPLPAGPPAAAPTAGARNVVTTHVVGPGENLTTIAGHYGVSLQTLTSMNGITNPNLVRVGQTLKVPVPAPTTVQALLEFYSHKDKMDPALIKALAWQESGWQQSVISPVGAVGVMQMMPYTTAFTSNTLLMKPVDASRVSANIEAGVAFFAYLLKEAGGNEQLAVAGYYQGLKSVRTRGMYDDTKRYVANIEALKQRFAAVTQS